MDLFLEGQIPRSRGCGGLFAIQKKHREFRIFTLVAHFSLIIRRPIYPRVESNQGLSLVCSALELHCDVPLLR